MVVTVVFMLGLFDKIFLTCAEIRFKIKHFERREPKTQQNPTELR